jgi:tetratricopeptide (TPR) repeat protein
MIMQSHSQKPATAGAVQAPFTGPQTGTASPGAGLKAKFCIMRPGPANKISGTETAEIRTLSPNGLVLEIPCVELDECHISYDDNPAFRNRVILLFVLPSGRRIKAVAQTAWFERRSDVAQGFIAGLKFVGLAANDRKAIEEFLASLERKPPVLSENGHGDDPVPANRVQKAPTTFVTRADVRRRSNPKRVACMALVLSFLMAGTSGMVWHLSKPRPLHSSERALAICEYLSRPFHGTTKVRLVPRYVSLHFDKPSVAVLPIVRDRADNKDYYWEGLTADVIRSLAGLEGLHVFSLESVRQYANGSADLYRINRELGAEYVLTAKADSKRVEMKLLSAETGEELRQWQYSADLADLRRAQREIRNQTAAVLGVETQGMETTDTLGPVVLQAYDRLLQANSLLGAGTKAANRQAREMYAKAIDLDPSYARAYAMLALTHLEDIWQGWTDDRPGSLREAQERIESALQKAPQLAEAHAAMAQLQLLLARHDAALEAAEKAVAIKPNEADNQALLAMILLYSGRSPEAVTTIKRAMRLSPLSPPWYRAVLGDACFLENRYQEAISVFEDMLKIQGWEGEAHLGLAKVYSDLGRMEEARYHASMIKDLMPGFSLQLYENTNIFKSSVDLQRQIDALKKTGLT